MSYCSSTGRVSLSTSQVVAICVQAEWVTTCLPRLLGYFVVQLSALQLEINFSLLTVMNVSENYCDMGKCLYLVKNQTYCFYTSPWLNYYTIICTPITNNMCWISVKTEHKCQHKLVGKFEFCQHGSYVVVIFSVNTV